MNQAAVDILVISGWNVRLAAKSLARNFFDAEDAEKMIQVASRLDVPVPKGKTPEGKLRRCKNSLHWARWLRPIGLRWREDRNRRHGFVRKDVALFVSDPVFRIKRERNRSITEFSSKRICLRSPITAMLIP